MLQAKLLQTCLTLSDPMGCSLPGFVVHGILQARILECSLLQGIFPTQGLNLWFLHLLHWKVSSLQPATPGKTIATIWSSNFTLGIYHEKTKTLIQEGTCTILFIAALLIIAKTWKQPKCLSTDK